MKNEQNKTSNTEDNQYNGWTNYETWCVNLWLDNDEGSQTYWRQEAERATQESANCQMVEKGLWTSEQAARYNLAEQLKNEVEDSTPEMESSLCTDLLQKAFDNVNWNEIAENLIVNSGE